MCHSSPATFLVWSSLSTLLGAFLVFHLWSFDRFRCLKWNNGLYSGAFKRVMTYSFLTSVPLIIGYSIGFAIIKYNEGFISLPGFGVIPKPYQLWSLRNQHFIFPLYLMFSVGWGLELVTHLEELCFWLFLVNAGSSQQNWFSSYYFKTWAVGSVVGVIYMPLVTILTRKDPLKCEAYTFLAGSLGSLSLTIWFLPILHAFPSFLSNLKSEGVDGNTVVRLTKFHELNTLRIIFRFIFTISLLTLAIDGVRPHPTINTRMVVTDALATLAAIGVVISSALTLVIFFPRSVASEIAAKEIARSKSAGRSFRGESFSALETQQSQRTPIGTHRLPSSPMNASRKRPPSEDDDFHSQRHHLPLQTPPSQKVTLEQGGHKMMTVPIRPNRRNISGVFDEERMVETRPEATPQLSETNLSMHDQSLHRVNPMVHNFTSPIDLAYRQPPRPVPVYGRPF